MFRHSLIFIAFLLAFDFGLSRKSTTVRKSSTSVKSTTTTTTLPSTTRQTTITTSTSSPSPPRNCSDGWVYFEITNSCYRWFINNPVTWQEAETFCNNFDAHLVSIHSSEETFRLWEYVFYSCFSDNCDYFWTGLYTADNATTWQWSDNSPADYLYWYGGSPNYSNGDCGQIWWYGVFTRKQCDASNPALICRKTFN